MSVTTIDIISVKKQKCGSVQSEVSNGKNMFFRLANLLSSDHSVYVSSDMSHNRY